MTKTTETTAYDLAFAAIDDLPQVATPAAEAVSKRTDRPATAMIRRSSEGVSAALEALRPVDASLVDEIARKIQTPVTNLGKVFTLVMDDLDSLPILQSEMLAEIKTQMAQIESTIHTLDSQTLSASAQAADGQVAADTLADLIFVAVREIRTPVANMQGLLSLVLDDRSALAAPVADLLLVAFEQLEKLARVIDEVSETANVFKGRIDVPNQEAALDAIIAQAIQHARDEGFEYELVHTNQVPADAICEIGATAGQCLEQLIRHALLETLNYPHEMPIGLFVYADRTADGDPTLAVEIHDYAARPAGRQPNSLDQQVVCEMAHALQGSYTRRNEESGATVQCVTIPFASLGADTTASVVAQPAQDAQPATPAPAYQGLAVFSPARQLSRVIQEAAVSHLQIERVAGFDAMMAQINATHLPTVFVDADLLANVSGEQIEQFDAATQGVTAVFVLQHGEADVAGAPALFPMLWDDDMLAIAGMLEHPFRPGAQQENLTLITGDNAAAVRPWRSLLSATGNGSMWWPAARPVPAGRFPAMIGSVVVLAESTRVLPTATWTALSDLRVRDRKIVVLSGSTSCSIPQSRGWDIYRPNLSVCDDTLRRYILFNSPNQKTPRVAVIEDDILMRKLIVSAIEDQAQIVEMGSVQEALANLGTMSFDVILLDLFLPDGSGLEILKTIHSDPRFVKARNTPIVALTGSGDLELNQTVLEQGATEVLVKPMPLQVLRQKIALLTRQNRSQRISGPVSVVGQTPAPAAPATQTTQTTAAHDLPQVPMAPAAKPAGRRLPGMSKIISLRALAAKNNQPRPAAHECAVGD